ncbi:unnamed protein product [Phytophthora fragariaefolia]|uniref:Unnamed protein product n=1 Tax=Phytophthora fragariaefolia TaxID=1490495 RepID=A0A9W6TT50_9STRA|nr:unnamed protein product [Phytophthora fragariaefolia]
MTTRGRGVKPPRKELCRLAEIQREALYLAAWKSKLIIYLKASSEQQSLEKLQHKREKPLSRFECLLERQVDLPPRPLVDDRDATWQHALLESLLSTQLSYIKKLLCETLPSGFKGIATKRACPCYLTAGGKAGSSVEFTPAGFTLEKVSDKLNAIFGNKSKSEILFLASGKVVNHVKATSPKLKRSMPLKPKVSGLGKRKTVDEPRPDLPYNLGAMKCHYCAGYHNTVNNVGPHKMPRVHRTGLQAYSGTTAGRSQAVNRFFAEWCGRNGVFQICSGDAHVFSPNILYINVSSLSDELSRIAFNKDYMSRSDRVVIWPDLMVGDSTLSSGGDFLFVSVDSEICGDRLFTRILSCRYR